MNPLFYSFEFILLISVYISITLALAYFTYQSKVNDDDYFFAKQKISFFPALVSSVATESSVATILIFPQIGFQQKISLLYLPLGFIVGRYIVSRYYLPFLYKNRTLSIYEKACQNKKGQGLLSYAFLLTKFLSSGVRFFLGAHALSILFSGQIWFWLILMAGICGIYSLSGGLRAVVWTDQIQGGLIFFVGIGLLAFIAVDFFLQNIDPLSLILSSIDYFDSNMAVENAYFSPVLFLGGLVLSIGSHGTDQDLLQRILSTNTLKKAQKALFYSGLGAFSVISIYLFLGFFLSFQNQQGLSPETPLIDYVLFTKSNWLTSFFSILVFAATMSTIDSALHSTSAVWKALLTSKSRISSLPPQFFSFLSLLFLYIFAQGATYVHSYAKDFLSIAMGSMNYINGALIAIFTISIFNMKKLTTQTIAIVLVSNFCITLVANLSFPSLAWPYVTLLSTTSSLFLTILLEKRKIKKANFI